jgi:DNA repair exonuclease SbcCD ATPase subunit
LVELSGELSGDIKLHRQKYLMCEQNIKNIKESEVCPTCKRKYDNVDNTEIISKLEKEKEELIVSGKELSQQYKDVEEQVKGMKEKRELFNKKGINEGVKASLEVQILNLRNQYKEKRDLLNEYNKNHEAIDKNNKLDIEIYNTENSIRNLRNTKETNIRYIEYKTNEVSNFNKNIEDRLMIIKKIEEETKLLRHWRLYLDMVGKNGISKMVLRKTLPIINAQIANLLCDVCDFNVEISITDKNDIMFYLIKDGIKSDLTSGSGFERTAAALALRTVLGNISS